MTRYTATVLDASLRVHAIVAAGFIVVALGASWLVGYAVGGAGAVAPHWFYVPVLYAAARFGSPGAAATGAAAGVFAGPLLPLAVEGDVPQGVADWTVRMLFFVVIGQIMSLVIAQVRERNRAEIELLRAERSLRAAQLADEFEVWYQPIVALSTGEVVGAEALLRWRHPQRGIVAPAEFIPVLEETGLVVDVGTDVLRRACADVVRMTSEVGWDRYFKLAVNISARQLDEPEFVSVVRHALADTNLPSDWLHLELTEWSLVEHVAASAQRLEELRRLGIRIALDDFGTGHATLAQLRHLPIDVVKIDRSFVAALGAGDQAESVTAAVVTMAHALGMRTVAEGVEAPGQVAFLRVLGCELAQGYLFARPMPLDDLAALLGRRAPFRPIVAPDAGGTAHDMPELRPDVRRR